MDWDDAAAYEQRWADTWNQFHTALRNSQEYFNAFPWTFRLLQASLLHYGYFRSGFYRLKVHIYWRTWIPLIGIGLIVLVAISYYTSLKTIIAGRACCGNPNEESNEYDGEQCRLDCKSAYAHDATVAYISFMIIFHYISACFRSPGVALPTHQDTGLVNNDQPTTTMTTTIPQQPQVWLASEGRGGCCCFNSKLDVTKEQQRVNEYKELEVQDLPGIRNFPSVGWTFCAKCNITRPPRCRHCSKCNRCILQFDHHCVWLNNCIGYNNYRSFFLTVSYLTVGCLYGVAVLAIPFFDEINNHAAENGVHFQYENLTGFLDLPAPHMLFKQMVSGQIEIEVVLKLVFPLLAFVGILLMMFLLYHINYVLQARTTLEYKIVMDEKYRALLQGEHYELPHNPCDQGWSRNLHSSLGPFPLVFLPVIIEPRLNSTSKGMKHN